MARVLLIAPADGTDVGELWVGYQWAKHLAEVHDVTLLSWRKRTGQSAAEQLPGVKVVEWSEPPGFDRFERLNSLLKPSYPIFYRRARAWIKQALRRGERFDVAHQPVPVAMRYPSPAAGLGIPLVIGPVGGSLNSPTTFLTEESSQPWYMSLRRLDGVRLVYDPVLRRTYTTADCVVGVAPYVRNQLDRIPIRRFEIISDTALESLPESVERQFHLPSETDPLRLLFVGRVIRTKGARDAIRAMGKLTDFPVKLDIVGDGFDRPSCESLSAELGLASRVFFHGRLPRNQVDRFYEKADIFVFPSYREPGGSVVFEAMGYQLPLIVCDRGGPAANVDEHCAIILPTDSPSQLANGIAQAVRSLIFDVERRAQMGEASRARVEQVGLWSGKVEKMSEIYSSLHDTSTVR